jgi:hypothetical protein
MLRANIVMPKAQRLLAAEANHILNAVGKIAFHNADSLIKLGKSENRIE